MSDLPPIRIDADAHQARLGDRILRLRPLEYRFLAYLVQHAGRAVPRREVAAEVWGSDWVGSMKTIDQHISTLRKALGDQGPDPRYVITVRGTGWLIPRARVEQSAAPEPVTEDLAETLRALIAEARGLVGLLSLQIAAQQSPPVARARRFGWRSAADLVPVSSTAFGGDR